MEDLPMEFEKSYIRKLYAAEINPMEDLMIETKKFKMYEDEIESSMNELKELVDDITFKKIIKLTEAYNAQSFHFGEYYFVEGVKHGFKLLSSIHEDGSVESPK